MSQVNEVDITKLRTVLQTFNERMGQYDNNLDRHKLGRVLTLIDASIGDPEQRKAVKDLVNDMWWGPSNMKTDVDNPHTEIRGLCLALGFELYPEMSLPAIAGAPSEPHNYDKYAAEFYRKTLLATNNK